MAFKLAEKGTVTNKIRDELLALQAASRDGLLRAEDVVDWARGNPSSALYKQFTWDRDKAAREYWLYQARRLIQIHVVSGDGTPKLVSLTIDRKSGGGGYRAISDVVANKTLSAIMLDDALRELERVRSRFERVKELTGVWSAIDDAAARLRGKPEPEKRPAAS